MQNETKKALLDFLSASSQAWELSTLAAELKIPYEVAEQDVRELIEEAQLLMTKKGRVVHPHVMGLIPARANALRSGKCVAIPLDGSETMKLKEHKTLIPFPDDRILVRKAALGACTLEAITKRANKQLCAFLRVEGHRKPTGKGRKKRQPGQVSAIACDRRIHYPIHISSSGDKLQNDTIALLEVDVWPSAKCEMSAHVLSVLGDRSDVHARLAAIAVMHGFSTDYPVMPEFGDNIDAEIAKRKDLRDLLTFTIDGPFSKDFDDAVSLETLENGDLKLGVHIADVSHYVIPGTALDSEAYARGTSLYLPGLTIPMLPEILSNDLCSLMPDEDRLTMSLFMIIRDGKIIDHSLSPAVIRSHARLTYDEVNRLFDDAEHTIPEEIVTVLYRMRELSHILREKRVQAGCIELEMPEMEFVLNEKGEPTDLYPAERGDAELLIEDFMLAANETVAALAKHTQTPLVYRVHEEPNPDRLRDLADTLKLMDIPVHFGQKVHPKVLQHVLDQAKDHPAFDTVQKMVLRSMQRAHYSEEPLGHYALCMEDYCHFTSPIRRYPDLVVHRMLKQLLCGDVRDTQSHMHVIALATSEREQQATLAEREADDLMKALYMKDKVGSSFEGTVSSVKSWGLYVTLDNGIEGLVHVLSLDDYYVYNEKHQQLVGEAKGIVFTVGQRLRVRVSEVDIDRSEINLVAEEILSPAQESEK